MSLRKGVRSCKLISLRKISEKGLKIFRSYGILSPVRKRGVLQKRTLFGKAGIKTVLKTTLKALGKITISGIIAFMILTLFCYFYYSVSSYVINSDGVTNYNREADSYYFWGIEGFGWGKTNNEGFNNMFDYEDNMKIDVLIMGSSHMEALEVYMGESSASRLNSLLENEVVYNIGFRSHDFLICADNLKVALKKYQPTQYVIIETPVVSFSDEEIALVLNDEVPEIVINRRAKGIVAKMFDLLRKSSYFRLIEAQKDAFFRNLQSDGKADIEDPEILTKSDVAAHDKLLSDLLCKMSASAEEYGAKLIIAYHPSVSIASDGALNLNADQDAITRFKQSCDVNGILFLDMSNRFKEEYESTYILPYGFPNTPVGSGHLNKYGHAMMADELHKLILEDKQ